MSARCLFRLYVGWAIPTQVELLQIRAWLEQYALVADTTERKVRLVDMGAGSGVLMYLLHHVGVPAERLVAVDRAEQPQFGTEYWPIIRDGDYVVEPQDVFCVVWGHPRDQLGTKLKDYVARGGRCVLIWGGYQWGCCRPSAEYIAHCHNKEWAPRTCARPICRPVPSMC